MKTQKSIFGPLLLIAAGVIWYLIYAGIIPSANLWALTHIWPFVLIIAGVGLILRAFWKYSSIFIDVILIVGAVLAIIFAPRLGWTNPSITSYIRQGDAYFGPGEPGSGVIVSQVREVNNFSKIEVSYPAQIEIQQGTAASLKIEGEDNLLPGLKTQVRGDTLEIYYKPEAGKHVNPKQPVKITIVVQELSEVDFSSAGEITITGLSSAELSLSLSGAGSIKLVDLTLQEFDARLSGAGSLTASGTADELKVNISGVGSFDGAELKSLTVRIQISGLGSASVWVVDKLSANISGAGSVNYFGSPDVDKNISGLGSVNHSGNKE